MCLFVVAGLSDGLQGWKYCIVSSIILVKKKKKKFFFFFFGTSHTD